ncbi:MULTISPECIES: hypothetical protein [unclassified Streptomyces]|uniref:hypothetical protein n=1 Tax=unclassified Streptomyces TaxID=2593676 RepID=UPI003369EDC1
MRNWLRRAGRGRTVESGLGWPVPAAVRTASRSRMRELVDIARANYSRKGVGLDLEAGESFVVIPYLPESSPVKSWMCLVVAFPHPMELPYGERPRCEFARLDIAEADFASLPAAKGKVRDQFVHWMAWEAYQARRKARN